MVGFASGIIPKLPINLALVKGFSLMGVRSGAEIALQPHLKKVGLLLLAHIIHQSPPSHYHLSSAKLHDNLFPGNGGGVIGMGAKR